MPTLRSCTRRRLRLAASVLTLTWAAHAGAQSSVPPSAADADVAAARALFHEAVEDAREGRWGEARERYARSLALHDDAVTRYSLAVTDVELGRLVEARDGFRAYLTQTEHSPRGREYRDAATRALAAMEPRVPSLAIDVTPSDVEPSILVDGAPAAGSRFELDPGPHWIEVTARGYVRHTEDVTLTEGEDRMLSVRLTALAEPSGDATDNVEDGFPTGPVILMAAGGAVGLTGLGVGLAAVGRASGRPDDDPALDGIRRQATAGDVMAIVGAAAAAGGLVWWLVDDDAGSTHDDIAVGLTPTAAHLRVAF